MKCRRSLCDALLDNDEAQVQCPGRASQEAYYVVQLDDATVSITVCEDEAGTSESNRVAAAWLSENMPDVSVSPPMVSGGDVNMSA